jgi:hypothetical protein
MRSTTFDLVGMALTALAVLVTAGGGITWAYVRETRGGFRTTAPEEDEPAAPALAASDEEPPVPVHH